MSDKSNKLVSLFPESYAAGETESLLYKLLDTFGAALAQSDDVVRQLLRSIGWTTPPGPRSMAWVRSLASSGGNCATTRWRPTWLPQRLKSIVRLFTGGGTPSAVIGAARSALGLPSTWRS